MYTTLDQQDMVECVAYAVKEAYGRAEDPPEVWRHKYIIYSGEGAPAEWCDEVHLSNPDIKEEMCYTAEEVISLVRILVKYTYIHNGGVIKQQIKGIPIGTNPAPHLADLTCYKHEAQLIDRLMREDIQQARRFLGTFRYIDDLLSADNPRFEEFVRLVGEERVITHQMYPDYLLLNKTTGEEEVTYLGMQISSTTRGFYINVTDNVQRLPQEKVNYPSLNGNFPESMGYGVFVGQLHRFCRICTSSFDFGRWATSLYNALLCKGYTQTKLVWTLKRFVRDCNPYKTASGAIIQRFLHEV
jgi:hypothetical protein